jgi:hypothetical protein
MSFIFKNENIKEKRCQIFLTRLYKAVTSLLILEENAASLIDQLDVKNKISILATNPGETAPVLPFGDELVLNWNSLSFDYESITKFISLAFNPTKTNPIDKIVYDKNQLSVLKPNYASLSDVDTNRISILPKTKAKLYNGLVTFPNLEKYDFDYKSYEILNEVYRALVLILDSVELFYSNFYTEETQTFFETDTLSDQFLNDLLQIVMIYDTRDMDTEIEGRISLKSEEILDSEKREEVMNLYRSTRDTIKYFAMFDAAPKLEKYIEELLFAVNGSRTYDIRFNMNLRVLEIGTLNGGTSSQQVIKHFSEEVFFPFHNKAILDQFTQGLNSLW